MRSCIFIIALTFFLYSCSNKNKIPAEVIGPLEMQGIMWDMMRADALAKEIIKKDSTKDLGSESDLLTKNVFHIHNINKKTFDTSFSFYKKHPDLFKQIFDSIYAQQNRKNILKNKKSKVPQHHLTIPSKMKNERKETF